MARFTKVLAALAAVMLLAVGVGAAPASAHGANHNIGVSGSMFLLDHESWGSNETGWHHYTGGVVVGGWLSQNQYSTRACVGGEVRGELYVTANDSSQYPGWVQATIDARLYEGTSCNTNDLDGRRTMTVWVAKGEIRNFKFRVNNTDEGGDYIDFNFNVANHTT
jgi:hypothetical protein